MSERKVEIPVGMLKTSQDILRQYWAMKVTDRPDALVPLLEAVLGWINKWGTAPNDAEFGDLVTAAREETRPTIWENLTDWERTKFLCGAWLREYVLEPKIKVAEIDAAIPDLLFDSPTHVAVDVANNAIRNAYRRGKEAK